MPSFRFFIVFLLLAFSSSPQAYTVSAMNLQLELKCWHGNNACQKAKNGLIILVHGDGPISYDADGYYDPIINFLNDKGYAVLSWSKPGVNGSTGDWLKHSMRDRQNLLKQIIADSKKRYQLSNKNIGLLGFSQATWVAPAVASQISDLKFMVGVSFPASWEEQSFYRTTLAPRYQGELGDDKALQDHRRDFALLRKKLDYQSYLSKLGPADQAISPERYEFVLKNIDVDSRVDFKSLKVPTLLIYGKDDKNINVAKNYREFSSGNYPSIRKVALIKGANHLMHKTDIFGSEDIDMAYWAKMLWYEEQAYNYEFFSTLSAWLSRFE